MLQAQKLSCTVNYACVMDEFVMRPEADVAISLQTQQVASSKESELIRVWFLSGVISKSNSFVRSVNTSYQYLKCFDSENCSVSPQATLGIVVRRVKQLKRTLTVLIVARLVRSIVDQGCACVRARPHICCLLSIKVLILIAK